MVREEKTKGRWRKEGVDEGMEGKEMSGQDGHVSVSGECPPRGQATSYASVKPSPDPHPPRGGGISLAPSLWDDTTGEAGGVATGPAGRGGQERRRDVIRGLELTHSLAVLGGASHGGIHLRVPAYEVQPEISFAAGGITARRRCWESEDGTRERELRGGQAGAVGEGGRVCEETGSPFAVVQER